MDLNIKHISVGRLDDVELVASYTFGKKATASDNDEVRLLLAKQNPIVPTLINVCQKQLSQDGEWNFLYDQDKLAYFILVKGGYPSRHSQILVEKVKHMFRNQGPDMLKSTPGNSYTSVMKSDVEKLAAQYEDLTSIDKLQAVNARVQEVKGVMHENIG